MARLLIAASVALTCIGALLFLVLFPVGPEPLLVSPHHTHPSTAPNLQDGSTGGEFLLGVGRADITGPVVEVNMMGYADTSQSGTGLRQRLYTRAFIIGQKDEPRRRIAYLVLDTQSGDTAVRQGILEGLAQLGEEFQMYNSMSLAVTGTHSHSGPGAWLNYLLPQITSRGFSKDSYEAIVKGSILAIQRAHANLVPGHLSYGQAPVSDANINRSPYAYLANPKHERALYTDDVDKNMTLLAFKKASDGSPMGVLSWFAVHGTSLYQNNTLITGDNKGVAAYLFEEALKDINPDFVAGFSQANVGDTSPNTLGAYCEDTGLQCRFNDSTCDGRTQGCHGRGPQFRSLDHGTKSCFEIGDNQYIAARKLLDSHNLEPISSTIVSSFHVFANMSSYTFVSPFNRSRILTTCSAALGYGFAGGTTDGPGAFDFRQGTNDSDDSPSLRNPVWKIARNFIHDPTDEQIECQHPKPILLDVGAAHKPYAWTPNIVDIQLMRIGQLIIIVAPGEATTMSGRRWRDALARAATEHLGIDHPQLVLGGPANTYAHYIATEEEYGVQRYEGASTLYGQHTLAAYVNLTLSYLPYLGTKDEVGRLEPLNSGPIPPNNVNSSYNFIDPVVVDNPGFFRRFGDVLDSPDPSKDFLPGEIVSAKFVGANPRNNFRLEGTFAAVEIYDAGHGQWKQIRSDRDWFLVYKWDRKSTILGTSEVTLEWEIEPWTQRGMYRLKYSGDSRSIGGKITPFESTSRVFHVGETPDQTAVVDELIRP